jgi:hypothetical protein
MCNWSYPCHRLIAYSRITSVGHCGCPFILFCFAEKRFGPRWLLDTDQDEDGMRVLADLHGGGNPEDANAKREFVEIKDNIYGEVRFSFLIVWTDLPLTAFIRSEPLARGLTEPCGRAIAHVY